GILGVLLPDDVGREAAEPLVLPAAAGGEGVHVQADEEVAVGGTGGGALAEARADVARPRHPDADPARLELVPQQQPHLQRDVGLGEATRAVPAGIAGILSPVA